MIHLTFEKRGNGILVSGDTFPIKADLKELGGAWNKTLVGWIFPASRKIAVIGSLHYRFSSGLTIHDMTSKCSVGSDNPPRARSRTPPKHAPRLCTCISPVKIPRQLPSVDAGARKLTKTVICDSTQDFVVAMDNFFCAESDLSIFHKLCHEAQADWIDPVGSGLRFIRNPGLGRLPTYDELLSQMVQSFALRPTQARLNYYTNACGMGPHQDAHAGRPWMQNTTIIASFGVARELVFKHTGGPGKGASFRHKDVSIWLRNGSALAFGAKLNDAWAHLVEGVNSNTLDSRRISVSQWGWSQLMNPKEL